MNRLLNICFISFFLFTTLASQLYGQEEKIHIAFFNPAEKTETWWVIVTNIMETACSDLGLELTVYWADRNHIKMVKQLKRALKQRKKPDVVVFQSFKMNGGPMLKIASDAKVPAFIFNAGLSDKLGHQKKYGKPREKLGLWIGQMLPNDEQAGYDVAKTLIKMARERNFFDGGGGIQILALEGTIADTASIERKKGLLRAVQEAGDVTLNQSVSAFWNREKGKDIFLGLIKRYPETHIVWAANDEMALGVIDGMKELKLVPGKDIIAGSVDWIPEALAAVKKGELAVSVGGHFMEAAWVMVLLHDFFNGKDFKSEATDFRSSMGVLTKKNIDIFLNNFGDNNWSGVDFSKFSKKIYPGQKSYDFSFKKVLQSLE